VSIERDLVSKILNVRDLAEVADSGVTPAFFQEHQHREAFRFILDHHRKYSSVPSEDAFKVGFDPTYRISECPDSLQYYVDTLTEHYSLYLLEDGLVKATDAFDAGNTKDAKKFLAETLDMVNREIQTTRVSDITQTGPDRLKRYAEYAKADGALKGISSGFSFIDHATGGFQKKQLITFVGPPKAGKSTIMLLAAMAAHMGFYRPLFIGFEMSNEEQEERHDAIRAGISHKKLREGRLRGDDMRAIDKMLKRLSSMPPLIFSEDSQGTSTVLGVTALVEKYKPDIVFVDGVYLMDDDHGERKGSPQALTNITRSFKRMAQNFDIAVAISTQVLEWKMDRKRGVTSGSIGYSSSFGQDSDCVIAVENTDDPNIKKVKIVFGRNTPGAEAFVLWDWETGEFTELEDPEEVDDGEDPKF
jgi:replicative DNA helicase